MVLFLLYFFLLTDGIEFQSLTLSEAQKIATEEDKQIFIHFYADWCLPCAEMESTVFNNDTISRFFHDHFISLKVDAEHESSQDVLQRFEISNYPTLLFLESSGQVIHRATGYKNVSQLMQIATEAQDTNNLPSVAKEKYLKDTTDLASLHQYTISLYRSNDTLAEKFAKRYLNNVAQWNERKSMQLVLQLLKEYQDDFFQYTVEKRHLFVKEFGQGLVDARLDQIIREHLVLNDIEPGDASEIYEDVFPSSKANRFADLFALDFFERQGNDRRIIEVSNSFVKNNEYLSWSILNQLAWRYYEQIEDEKALKKAIGWAKKSIQQNSNHYNNDTMAALLYKIGKYKQAQKFAETAIEMAKVAGESFETTAELLEKINRHV